MKTNVTKSLFSKCITPDSAHLPSYFIVALFRVSDDTFDLCRIAIIPFMCLFRVSLITKYLQAYLNMAKEKVDLLKKEAGRINSLELQKCVSILLCVACGSVGNTTSICEKSQQKEN